MNGADTKARGVNSARCVLKHTYIGADSTKTTSDTKERRGSRRTGKEGTVGQC